jgi:hypothetical protein
VVSSLVLEPRVPCNLWFWLQNSIISEKSSKFFFERLKTKKTLEKLEHNPEFFKKRVELITKIIQKNLEFLFSDNQKQNIGKKRK